MDSTDILLIVGAGNAGAELALSARQQGWAGAITVLGDEAPLPYHRPPLSKAYLSGKTDAEALSIRPAQAYEKASVALRLGTHVEAIDRDGKALLLNGGERLEYTKLALCLGGRPRPIVVDGLAPPRTGRSAPANLLYLRTRADADALRTRLKPACRLVVIGGGYVGLEVAASACALGAEVTVLEAQPRVLARVAGPELSAFYEGVHRDAGVDVRTGVGVSRIECAEETGDASTVVCSDGSRIDADLLVVGIGMLPNVELAAAAGLEVDGGIVVNEFAQTSDRHIYAAGDCTWHPSAAYGRCIRLESVPNALEQARAAAATLCGKAKAYNAVPWFWSDQYDLKLQIVGLSQGYDRVVLRGSMAARSFVAFYLREGRLLAADAVNRPGDFMVAKRLVAAGGAIDVARLADDAISLKTLLEGMA